MEETKETGAGMAANGPTRREFLKQAGVPRDYTEADLEDDRRTLAELRRR